MSAPLLVDGLVYSADGWNEPLAESGLALLHVTAGDFLSGFERVCDDIAGWWDLLERDRARLFPVRDAADLAQVGSDARVGIVLGLQNAQPLGESPQRVEIFWRLGIRVLQLTYNEANLVADGCIEERDGGLTRLGRRVVDHCNTSGVLVDLSHTGRRATLETIEASRVPVAVTHSNRRARAENPRNKTDDVLRALAERGGVVGASPWGPMCWNGRPGEFPTVETFVGHVLDLVELLGADSVAIGTDLHARASTAFLGALLDRAPVRFPEVYGAYVAEFGNELSERYCRGFDSIRDWRTLPARLAEAGLDDEAVAKVCGRNWLRLYGAVWSAREREVA